MSKEVPWVNYCFPIVGHGPQLIWNNTRFLKQSFATYGNAFKIKVFRVKVAVFCDRIYSEQMLQCGDDQFSMFRVLNDIYIGEAFQECGLSLKSLVAIFKKVAELRAESILPVIQSQTLNLIENIRHASNLTPDKLINLKPHVSNYVVTTTAKCLFGINLTDEMLQIFQKYVKILSAASVASHIVPKWIIRACTQWKLNQLCRQFGDGILSQEIETYRSEKNKSLSPILRAAVDSHNERTMLPLSNNEIACVIVSALYIGAENTSVCIINNLIDLYNNPEILDKLRKEIAPFVSGSRDILEAPFFNACILESTRLNSNIFELMRTPIGIQSLGEYCIRDVDMVAMSPFLINVHGSASKHFSQPTKFNPDRYFGSEQESLIESGAMIYGSGQHACPGKSFAIYVTKMALAMFITGLSVDLEASQISDTDYLSTGAMAERTFLAKFNHT